MKEKIKLIKFFDDRDEILNDYLKEFENLFS